MSSAAEQCRCRCCLLLIIIVINIVAYDNCLISYYPAGHWNFYSVWQFSG